MVSLNPYRRSQRATARRLSSFMCVVPPFIFYDSRHAYYKPSVQPSRYATMLAERMASTNANCWLVNTGWTGGKYGTGDRCPLKYTRRIVDAIHSGELADATTEYENFEVFNLTIPTHIEGVPRDILNPKRAWKDKEAFQREVTKLAAMFEKAFRAYENDVEEAVRMSGPSRSPKVEAVENF